MNTKREVFELELIKLAVRIVFIRVFRYKIRFAKLFYNSFIGLIKVLVFVFGVGVFYWLFINNVSAQVVINEIYSWESSGDWIELYAFEDTDISDWVVRDLADTPIKTISDGTIIGPGYSMYFIIDAGNRLNKDGDVVKLFKSGGMISVDEISYGNNGGVCAPQQGQSIGRYPDANTTIDRFSVPSKNASNNDSVLAPCPTPTSMPSNTPVPSATSKPTFTPTPAPTNTPTPTPTPIPTKTPTPTKVSDDSEEESQILGAVDDEEINDDEEKLESEKKGGKFPLASGAFILVGLGLISFPVVNYLRLKKGYNHKDD